MAPKYELCVGLNKGHKTTKIKQKQYRGERKEKGIRQARKKNVSFSLKVTKTNSNPTSYIYDENITNPFTDRELMVDRFSSSV